MNHQSPYSFQRLFQHLFELRSLRAGSTWPLALLVTLMLTAVTTAPAMAAPDLSEHGSVNLSSAVVASAVWTGVEVLSSVPTLSVAAVEVSAEGTVWLLRGIAEGSGQAVEVSVKVAGGASLAVGTVLEVITSTAGSLLVASGEALAFIPNELGASLFYSETWDQHHHP